MTARIDCRPPRAAVVDVVTRALAEDMLPMGDLTASLVDPEVMGHFVVRARAEGVLAGLDCLIEAFAQIDSTVTVSPERFDGDRLEPGALIATVSGPLRGILSAERTALNIISHLSGVASLARRYVDAVEAVSPHTGVLDTRKTTPGLRALEKAAVRAGGGANHRGSLSEAVLVKDNHLAGLGIAEAVAKARRFWPGRMVEVECDRLDQVVEAVAAGATMVLLDNMGPEQVKECVAVARSGPANVLVEVSGGVNLQSAPILAGARPDFISVGAITHSAPVLDIGLDIPVPGTGPDIPVPGTGPDIPVPGTGPDIPVPGTGPDIPVPGTGPDMDG